MFDPRTSQETIFSEGTVTRKINVHEHKMSILFQIEGERYLINIFKIYNIIHNNIILVYKYREIKLSKNDRSIVSNYMVNTCFIL